MRRSHFLRGLLAIPLAAVLPSTPPERPDTPGHDGPELSPKPSAPPRGASSIGFYLHDPMKAQAFMRIQADMARFTVETRKATTKVNELHSAMVKLGLLAP